MRRSLLAAALLLLVPISLAGCGGDGEPSGSSVASKLAAQLPVIGAEATCDTLDTAGSYRCTVTGKDSAATLTYSVTCDAETCTAKNEAGGPSLTFPLDR